MRTIWRTRLLCVLLAIITVFLLFCTSACEQKDKDNDGEPPIVNPGDGDNSGGGNEGDGDDNAWTDADGQFTIYPAPQTVSLKEEKKYTFDGSYYYDAVMEVNAQNKMTQVISAYYNDAKKVDKSQAGLKVEQKTDLETSGYTIDVSANGIEVKYQNGEGAYYAAVTLNQLFKQKANGIPYISITDYPDMAMRGYHISSQNKVGKVETYKSIIDELAALKMNVLELAVFRPSSIQIDTFAPITKYETGLTEEECNEITEYGAKNYVRVVPYMETFGHMDELLRYPQFVDLRNTFTQGCQTLSIYDPAVHAFLESYVDDMVDCFNPEFITIGGDEVAGILTGKNLENAPEGATELDVFIYYLELMYGFLDERGIDMYVCYDVINRLYATGRKPLKEMFERMPNCTIIVWQYEEDSVFTDACDRFDKLGAKYVIMPSTNSFTSVAGRLTTAEMNITKGVGVAVDRNTGVIIGMYGDGGTRNTWTNEYSALAYGGGCCWNYEGNVNKTNISLSYVNEYIYGESTGKLSEAWTLLQRHNDVLGRSWGLAWLSYIGNNGYVTSAALDLYLNLYGTDYASHVVKMEEVITRAQNVLDVLETVTLTGKYAVRSRAEIQISAKQMLVLAEYAKMLMQLRGGLKTEEELQEKAAEMYDYAYDMMLEFRETWLLFNKKGVLEDTINWLNIPMGLFGNIGHVYEITGDNLFFVTPDSIEELDEKLFSKGYIWNCYGKNYPTISVVNGIYSHNDIDALIHDGSLTLHNTMTGVNGKVFEIDGLKLYENYHYQFYYGGTDPYAKLKSIFTWPCLFKGTGTYQMTVKVKFESGRTVDGSTVAVSGTAYAEGLRNFVAKQITYSAPDSNGWVTITYEYDNVENYEFACIGINSKPELLEDKFYISELKLIKK